MNEEAILLTSSPLAERRRDFPAFGMVAEEQEDQQNGAKG